MDAAEDLSAFFAVNRPADKCAEQLQQVAQFLANLTANDKVVLVTSGGTVVPLERQTVRYLDNFSTGSRGAISTEHFLKTGYRVVFLHRRQSITPFTRKTHLLFEEMELDPVTDKLRLKDEYQDAYRQRYVDYAQFHKHMLLVDYYSVADYLHLLAGTARLLARFHHHAMLFLAAAVSDFYLADRFISEHKICSDEQGELRLHLSPVPKMIRHIRTDCCPDAFVVTFKLETEETLVLPKAEESLRKHGHQLVVANCLASRKHRVMLVNSTDDPEILAVPSSDCEIEAPLVRSVALRHDKHMR